MTDDLGWFSEETATFGDRLAGAREAAGMDQKALAEKLGVKTNVISGWENDLKEPRANRLQMVSGILGVSITWLLTGEGDGPDAPDDHARTHSACGHG
ncbi:MAG: helix-turn-helix domain-containing protein, partial [Paracoccaceae bacterium]|nr:helix-turn-helix domain-containing protein [Paracoccaceae bacterium]